MEAVDVRHESRAGMEFVSCDLCQSDRTDPMLRQRDLLLNVTEDEFSIVRCRECGLAYLNPRPSQSMIGRYYPDVYYPPVPTKSRSAVEVRAKRLSARIKRWVLEDYYSYPSTHAAGLARVFRRWLLWPEKTLRELKGRSPLPWRGEGHILDVGCGAGGNLRVLQDQGWHVSGVEISEVAAAHARELVSGHIHTGTLDSAPFSSETFDLILMSHSLEHLPSPAGALRIAYRLLKKDGLLAVTVPNLGSLEARLFGSFWFHWDPPRHFYHFDKRTLIRLLEQTGFHPTRLKTGVGTTFFMASLERFWKCRFGKTLRFRKFVERMMARPLCLIAGHTGYGTELTVYAVKGEAI